MRINQYIFFEGKKTKMKSQNSALECIKNLFFEFKDAIYYDLELSKKPSKHFLLCNYWDIDVITENFHGNLSY